MPTATINPTVIPVSNLEMVRYLGTLPFVSELAMENNSPKMNPPCTAYTIFMSCI